MVASLKLSRERLVICKLMLRMIHLSNDAGGTDWIGSGSDDVLLLAGIYVCQAENKPVKAAKLSQFVHMPRATVVRKLQEMQRLGFVELSPEGHALLRLDAFNNPLVVRAVELITQAIKRAAAELSKMDSQTVA